MKKKCVICGREFDAGGTHVTCSEECRAERRKQYARDYYHCQLLDPEKIHRLAEKSRRRIERYKNDAAQQERQREYRRKYYLQHRDKLLENQRERRRHEECAKTLSDTIRYYQDGECVLT